MPFDGILCKANLYIAILRYRRAADEVAVEICAFVLQIFFVTGMQIILFYNVVYVYVYVCKIGEEKFGGCCLFCPLISTFQQEHIVIAYSLAISGHINC